MLRETSARRGCKLSHLSAALVERRKAMVFRVRRTAGGETQDNDVAPCGAPSPLNLYGDPAPLKQQGR